VDNGELSPRTFDCSRRAAGEFVSAFGKARLVADVGPDEFAGLRKKLAKRLGAGGLGTMIQCVRCLFKHAGDNDLIGRRVCYGASFRKPSKKTLHLRRAEAGPKALRRRRGAPPPRRRDRPPPGDDLARRQPRPPPAHPHSPNHRSRRPPGPAPFSPGPGGVKGEGRAGPAPQGRRANHRLCRGRATRTPAYRPAAVASDLNR